MTRLTQLILGEPSEAVTTTTQEVTEWVDLRVATAMGIRDAWNHIDPLHRYLAIAYFGSERRDEVIEGYPEKICREGLQWLSHAAKSRGSDQFLSLMKEQQVEILDAISDARQDKQTENAGTRFFTYVKSEVIRGYYTSQAGSQRTRLQRKCLLRAVPGVQFDNLGQLLSADLGAQYDERN